MGGAAGRRALGRMRTLVAPLSLPDYRRIWTADMISLLGDWAGRLALAVVVYQRTGSAAWAAAVTAVSLAGFVGIGQVLATLADRFGRISVMLVADGVRAACFGLMLLPLPVPALLGLALLAGFASPPFEAARAAALPDLVPEKSYGAAVAFSGICVQASLVLGYGLGGALLTVVDAQVALGINAGTFIVSGLVLLPLRHSAAAAPSAQRSTVGASLREAARVLVDDSLLRRAILLLGITSLLGIVPEALVVPYGDLIGFGDGATGLLAAAVPIGTIVGTAIVPTAGDHARLLRAASVCAVVTAGLAAPLLLLEVGGAAAVLTFAVAGGIFAVGVPTNVVLGMRLTRETRASAMGIALGVVMGSQALGAALGGVAASQAGIGAVAGGSLALAGIWCLWALLSTPPSAKHRARPGRRDEPTTVLDLVALEAEPSTPVSTPQSNPAAIVG